MPKSKSVSRARASKAKSAKPARKPVSCTTCAHCCTYLAIEINGPTTLKRATELLWYLYHERVSLYECDDEWMVQFETRCKNLGDDHRCGVYDTRPHICRDYSEKECEINSEDTGQTFYTTDALLAHLKVRHPRIHKKIEAGYLPPPAPASKRLRLPLFEQRYRELRAMGVA